MNTFIMESSVVRPATNPYGRLERNSVVGYEGEHNARSLVVETTDDLSAYASVSLIIDDLDCGAMTKTTSGSKTVLSLTLTSAMIGASGRKLCQLLMVDSNNTVIAKSSQFVILIKRSNDIERSVEDGVSFIIISEAVTEMAQEAASAAAEEAAADVVAECQTIANTAAGSASAAAQSAAAAQAAAESIVVDSTLDTASTNAIQNKVVASELATIKADLGDYEVMSLSTDLLSFSIISSGKWNVVSSTGKIRSSVTKIPEGVRKIRIEAQENSCVVAFFNTYTAPVHGETPDFSTGYTERMSLDPGEVREFDVEEDMCYLYNNRVNTAGDDCTPLVKEYSLKATKQVSSLRSELTYELAHSFTDDKVYNYAILNSGLWSVVTSGTSRSSIVKIPPNCARIIVKPTGENSVFAFLKGQSYPWHNGVPEMSESHPSRITITEEVSYDRQTDMRFIYILRINSSAEDITPDLTFVCTRSDAESEPTYVAFGASTTVGAVHHYDGTNITYTYLNYPAIVGERLGLKTYNNGHGSTGFLARGSEGTTPNFLDSIMGASEELSRASLVSIVFGYGNDYSAGLPIGEWDDYYPYDETGYHPSGSEGITEMLSKGITLMGALNWCIRYLQTNFPKAQLVIIFSAPSANRYRDVSLSSQTPGTGSAPYKLNVVDPYDNPTGSNAGIKQISEEMAKLQKAISIPMIDAFSGVGTPFSWYATRAVDSEGNYVVFSTTGSASAPVWNSHPNEDGYLVYGRYIAGLITSQFVG